MERTPESKNRNKYTKIPILATCIITPPAGKILATTPMRVRYRYFGPAPTTVERIILITVHFLPNQIRYMYLYPKECSLLLFLLTMLIIRRGYMHKHMPILLEHVRFRQLRSIL